MSNVMFLSYTSPKTCANPPVNKHLSATSNAKCMVLSNLLRMSILVYVLLFERHEKNVDPQVLFD